MRKITVSTGIYWVEIPGAGLRILCGCPADAVKHLMRRGLIVTMEKNGVTYESGPNAILLSDVPLQNERFSNLGEFPVLQMLYRQGMILPGHPNNTGARPMLIGARDQVEAQSQYIFRGNYGLADIAELEAAGESPESAREMMRLKLRFAFNKIKATDELLDMRVVGDESVELAPGAFVRRKALNIYEFMHNDERVTVDLNLAPGQDYDPPYNLGFHELRRDYFSVVHSGEGDGWDLNRPCMGSIITFQGKIFLIDAGPNLVHSLTALGISVNEIEGVFHTHAHDDHFNGMTVLLRADHRIKYYATPLVRASVEKKLSALLHMKQGAFDRYFEVHELTEGQWNDVDGLEVLPANSPHPVETTIMFFRALWEDGFKTYAHMADIAAFDVLKKMITDDPAASGVSQEYFDAVRALYLTPVDLKKIDCGGGLIHGKPEDFAADGSGKIIISHSALPFKDSQLEIGATASFGAADILIRADQDYTKPAAFSHLREYFPAVPLHELRMLLNCPTAVFNPGSILVKRGEHNGNIYFVLSGVMDLILSSAGIHNRLSVGSMAGELSGVMDTESRGTYVARSVVRAISIPSGLYRAFLERNGLMDDLKGSLSMRRYLQSTWLFGEMLGCPLKSRIVKSSTPFSAHPGERFHSKGGDELFLIREGEAEVVCDDVSVSKIGPSEFFGAEHILFGEERRMHARAITAVQGFRIPASALEGIPIVHWKLLETYEKRLRGAHLPE
jgi:hemerythrin